MHEDAGAARVVWALGGFRGLPVFPGRTRHAKSVFLAPGNVPCLAENTSPTPILMLKESGLLQRSLMECLGDVSHICHRTYAQRDS